MAVRRVLVVMAVMAAAFSGLGANAAMAQPVAPDAVDEAALAGTVTDDDGPVAGVAVDLFVEADDGSRAEWLGSVRTDETGRAGFTASAGCYVLTFIAPPERLFIGGSPWANARACVEPGGTASLTASLGGGGGGELTVSGEVTQSSDPVGGVAVDLFELAADGQRGNWISQTTTDSEGRYGFSAPDGCYAVTVIAPDGATFVVSGTGWRTFSFCLDGRNVDGLGAVLRSPASRTIELTVMDVVGFPGQVTVDLYTSDQSGQRIEWRESVGAPIGDRVSFEVSPGCWVVTLTAPPGELWNRNGESWFNRHVCLLPSESVDLGEVPGPVPPRGQELAIATSITKLGVEQGANPVHLYEAEVDGSRGQWLSSGVTSGPRDFPFVVPYDDGDCFVVTFEAPAGETFAITKTRWINNLVCPRPRDIQAVTSAELVATNPDGPVVEIGAGVEDLVLAVGADGVSEVGTVIGHGELAFMVLGTIGGNDCQSSLDASIAIYVDSQLTSYFFDESCRAASTVTVPEGAEVFVQVRPYPDQLVTGVRLLVGRQELQRIEVAPTAGGDPVVVSAGLDHLFREVELVISGEPNQLVTVERLSACDPVVTMVVIEVEGAPLRFPVAGTCQALGPWMLPPSGSVTVRFTASTRPFRSPQPMDLSLRLLDLDTVTVDLPQTGVSSRRIDDPYDGTLVIVNGSPGEWAWIDLTANSDDPNDPCPRINGTALVLWPQAQGSAGTVELHRCGDTQRFAIPDSGRLEVLIVTRPWLDSGRGYYAIRVRPGG